MRNRFSFLSTSPRQQAHITGSQARQADDKEQVICVRVLRRAQYPHEVAHRQELRPPIVHRQGLNAGEGICVEKPQVNGIVQGLGKLLLENVNRVRRVVLAAEICPQTFDVVPSHVPYLQSGFRCRDETNDTGNGFPTEVVGFQPALCRQKRLGQKIRQTRILPAVLQFRDEVVPQSQRPVAVASQFADDSSPGVGLNVRDVFAVAHKQAR